MTARGRVVSLATMDDQLLRAVTIHRFSADEQPCDELADELAAFFEKRQAHLHGLRDTVVLIGYGVERVTVIAGWESREAQIAGIACLRADPDLLAIAKRSGLAEHDEYRVASCGLSPETDGGC